MGTARRRAVVPHPDEHQAGPPMSRKIVGEGAHRLADALDWTVLARRRLAERLLALDELGFEVGHEGLESRVGVGGGHVAI